MKLYEQGSLWWSLNKQGDVGQFCANKKAGGQAYKKIWILAKFVFFCQVHANKLACGQIFRNNVACGQVKLLAFGQVFTILAYGQVVHAL